MSQLARPTPSKDDDVMAKVIDCASAKVIDWAQWNGLFCSSESIYQSSIMIELHHLKSFISLKSNNRS